MKLSEASIGFFTGTNAPHLYFVPLIVVFYMAYPLLLKLGNHVVGVSMSLFITFYSLLVTWGVTVEGFTRNHNPLNWIFYFVFGIWVAQTQDLLKKKVNQYWAGVLLLVSLAFVILEPIELTEKILLIQTRPSIILYSVMVIVLFSIIKTHTFPFKKELVELSKYSYHIFLSHYLFIYLYRDTFPDLNLLVVAMSILLLSYGVSKLIGHKIT